MRSGTKTQVPNLRGKKQHTFGCRCCWAFNDKDDRLAKITNREAAEDINDNQAADAQ